jgi:DNA-binding transcriptional MerR regulator/methylmalonyl-CoA mutase cobalamin-binding subunit
MVLVKQRTRRHATVHEAESVVDRRSFAEARRMTRSGKGMLSIGALSAATGVPVETIRSWERRYGFPVAERKPSGHRVYSLAIVPRLRLVSDALARGHRAAEVVAASEATLESLLAALPQVTAQRKADPAATFTVTTSVQEHFGAIRAFDAETLKRRFQAEWSRLGPLPFVQERAAPLLEAVGDAWSTGELDVRHEHFVSACMGDFLRSVRMPLDDRATGPVVALATLPGELHGLGLQMSAVVFAAAGWRALVLGVNTPIEQIVALTREASIAAVALSCAAPRRRNTTEQLRTLRRRLPRAITLLVGGSGAPNPTPRSGIEVMTDLATLDRWLHERAA